MRCKNCKNNIFIGARYCEYCCCGNDGLCYYEFCDLQVTKNPRTAIFCEKHFSNIIAICDSGAMGLLFNREKRLFNLIVHRNIRSYTTND